MDIFKIHKSIIDDYSSYISSFTEISDKRIREKVDQELNSGRLWPDPLIQFNPSFEKAENISDLCNNGILHEKLQHVFNGYTLFRHQVDALKLGVIGKDFIVTSGTGSGKSLTYIGSIFNHIFSSGDFSPGIRAIIVYPMNPLINSQNLEIGKHADRFVESSKTEFPITFKQYTGQEGSKERDEIKLSPPHILLTNYMMLELIMTRLGEKGLRESIRRNLRFLIFDELHTYRGRQGSDVSMLIRRIRAQSEHDPICIGTSATMISGDTIDDQKEKVAEVASTIFGKKFSGSQIVNEKLIRSLGSDSLPLKKEDIQKALKNEINENGTREELTQNPLSVWLENDVALDEVDGTLVRRKPMSRKEIVEKLSLYSEVKTYDCDNQILRLLKFINNVNKKIEKSKDLILPFKIHQFIGQTGSVYVTLDNYNNREITLDATIYINDESKNKKPVYPVVFSRYSGYEFLCVSKNIKTFQLESREFKTRYLEGENEKYELGYLIPEKEGEEIWNPYDIEQLPDSWFKHTKKKGKEIKKEYSLRIPKRIFYDEFGNYSDANESNESNKSNKFLYSGWFMSAPLLFDPTSGMFYDTKTTDNAKLSRIGNEGRSTATTVLSFSILKTLNKEGLPSEQQKLLSFTDVRQDASLQSGHFNDFIKVGLIRSSIVKALKKSENHTLDYSNIDIKVFEAMNISQEEYANNSAIFPGPKRENENAFKLHLIYKILYDLRRGWRVNLPNLEQCALLKIEYKYLDEIVATEEAWKNVLLLKDISPSDRKDILIQILNYFRYSYALSFTKLQESEIEKNTKIIKEKINTDWGLDKNERIEYPYYLRVESIGRTKRNIFTASIGPGSYLGKYLKNLDRKTKEVLKGESYNNFIHSLLKILEDGGLIKSEKIKSEDSDISVYQLCVDSILWNLGNTETILEDKVRQRSYKDIPKKPNRFFQNFYAQPFLDNRTLIGREHTAMLDNEQRKIREEEFRKGKIGVLYCSPSMELGVDISTLNIVHMRNVPPNPSNYAQRSGRAGRSGEAALIITYCSNYSPHDKHYFRNAKDMVSGVVAPPRIDLINEELLQSHFNSLYLEIAGLNNLDNSVADLLDLSDPEKLTLKSEIIEKFNIPAQEKERLESLFKIVIKDYEQELINKTKWYNEGWLKLKLGQFIDRFDKSLDRWRKLFKSADDQLHKASSIIHNPIYKGTSEEVRRAKIDQAQALRQRDILKNELKDSSRQNSEFYPYRYLASEGFLPGYNFTRLPIRLFVPSGDEGKFIARPKFLALREYGPGNIVYYDGTKYKVSQMLISDGENKLFKMKVSKKSGYAMIGEEYEKNFCPFTNTELNDDSVRENYTDLLEMNECRAVETERISCEEEERLTMGYLINTFFTLESGLDRTQTALIKDGEDQLLKLQYMPAATLIKVNEKWALSKNDEKGYLINLKTGFWKKEKDFEDYQKNDEEKPGRIRLFASDTANALYIYPLQALALTANGVITLQYALKRAIENVFQVESSELDVEKMGDPVAPNIMIYESSEGSLGILSQIIFDKNLFMKIIQEAYKLCYFKDGVDTNEDVVTASYNDLLSYYNQRDHLKIDRHLIKDALEKLLICDFEILTNNDFENYDDQYNYLNKRIDPNSQTEKKFLKYLYDNSIKLPDKAQYQIPDLYIMPDFYYEKEKACIFCDGTPHDKEDVQKEDQRKRDILRNKGYDVILYYYKDSLDDLINRRSDVFKKVR